jgi:hypothetical protein
MNRITRRLFLCLSGISALVVLFSCRDQEGKKQGEGDMASGDRKNIGILSDGKSYVYLSRNGTPEQNMRMTMELMGGVGNYIGLRDIVLLKPNAQWWNQGTTNTDAMRAFIEMVLEIPGFQGEIIVAENHHFPDENSRGWTTEQRNGAYNLNELVHHFQRIGKRNVTKHHWRDGGPSRPGYWGGAENGGIVTGPGNGDGYMWRSDLVYVSPTGRKAMMSYPIFTSKYSGITIDFKEGLWKNGAYLKDRKLRFINFAGLNHHGPDTGITASIKNYLGICDMTCGYRGTGPEGFHNFHYVGYNILPGKIKYILGKFGWREKTPAMGACVGYFIRTVRAADLNVVTAEWVGYGSRTDLNLREQAKTVLASVDPVALDFIAARDVMMPATKKHASGSVFESMNDPEKNDSPTRQFLEMCHETGVGNISPGMIVVREFSYS